MISSVTNVHILDIDKEANCNGSIASFFAHYSYLWKSISENESEIDFSGMNVKIKDWTGWTQLNKIVRIENNRPWSRMVCTDLLQEFYGSIIIRDQMIPVYDNSLSKPGFHGEVKYKYILRNDLYLNGMEKFVMRVFVNGEQWQQFIPMRLEPVLESNPMENRHVGYDIYTKSGFFNANGFHLCSSDTRIEDGKESWK